MTTEEGRYEKKLQLRKGLINVFGAIMILVVDLIFFAWRQEFPSTVPFLSTVFFLYFVIRGSIHLSLWSKPEESK